MFISSKLLSSKLLQVVVGIKCHKLGLSDEQTTLAANKLLHPATD